MSIFLGFLDIKRMENASFRREDYSPLSVPLTSLSADTQSDASLPPCFNYICPVSSFHMDAFTSLRTNLLPVRFHRVISLSQIYALVISNWGFSHVSTFSSPCIDSGPHKNRTNDMHGNYNGCMQKDKKKRVWNCDKRRNWFRVVGEAEEN